METPYTDDTRVSELEQSVREYLNWINRVDADLKEHCEKAEMRLKPVNRHMVTEPVY